MQEVKIFLWIEDAEDWKIIIFLCFLSEPKPKKMFSVYKVVCPFPSLLIYFYHFLFIFFHNFVSGIVSGFSEKKACYVKCLAVNLSI